MQDPDQTKEQSDLDLPYDKIMEAMLSKTGESGWMGAQTFDLNNLNG